MDWNDFKIVLAIRRAGSLAGAARDLSVNHSTVFRRLTALEEAQGVRLFDRLQSGYAPTQAGEDMAETAAEVEAKIHALDRRLAGLDTQLAGRIRVTAPDDLMTHWLIPIIADFRVAQPGIVVEAAVTNRMLDLSKRDADIALRPTNSPPETLVGRRLGDTAMAIYVVDALAGDGTEPADWGGDRRPWVVYDSSLASIAAAQWQARHIPEANQSLFCDSVNAAVEATRAGIGLGMLPCMVGDQLPELTRIGGARPDLGPGLWLLTHQDLRGTARIRAFMDFVADRARRDKNLIEGTG
ncbi:MAG: LysR family transcriptional regulator [Alphaproteobacteria bacterium]|nr:LysR family transcriptional regulator [Alphaproteobacteria bacterium]